MSFPSFIKLLNRGKHTFTLPPWGCTMFSSVPSALPLKPEDAKEFSECLMGVLNGTLYVWEVRFTMVQSTSFPPFCFPPTNHLA